jgi:hypothetical protein
MTEGVESPVPETGRKLLSLSGDGPTFKSRRVKFDNSSQNLDHDSHTEIKKQEHGGKTKYGSRRKKDFDDQASEGEADDGDKSYVNTNSITYRDT